MNAAIILISNTTTIAAIIMAFYVIRHWFPDVRKITSADEKMSPQHWFIVGVFISFIGQILDNIYWGTAWTFHYINQTHTVTEYLFEHGTIYNIFFRQFPAVIAAYCHIKAAFMYANRTEKESSTTVIMALGVGLAFSCLVVFIVVGRS